MKQLACMVIILITVAYISVGGIIFHVLEASNEQTVRKGADDFFINFLANKSCLTEDELRRLLKAVFQAYTTGYLVSNNTEAETNWDFYSSIFFAITVVTTIGYGNISPITVPGRIFCTCFAVIGIPLFLVTASAIGQRLYWITKKVQRCCFRNKDDGSKTIGAKICAGTFYFLFGVGLFIFVPASIFMLMEGWTLLEGAYYSFITLSTIGFGDYVAGTKDKKDYSGFRGIYRLCVAGWIFVGLSWMAGIFGALQEFYTKPQQIIDSDATNKSVASRNSLEESRNQRELMRVYSMDSGYAGMNGNKVQGSYNRQHSYDSFSNNLPSQTCEEPQSDPDVYLTKL